MISQIEEGDTKGGIIIPKDKFLEFRVCQKKWVGGYEHVGDIRYKLE